jgi:hypothetical protein
MSSRFESEEERKNWLSWILEKPDGCTCRIFDGGGFPVWEYDMSCPVKREEHNVGKDDSAFGASGEVEMGEDDDDDVRGGGGNEGGEGSDGKKGKKKSGRGEKFRKKNRRHLGGRVPGK